MRTSLALVAILGWAARVSANEVQGDVMLGPMSVAQLGSSGLYGTYALGKAFENPSMLSIQPRTLTAEFQSQARFGGEQWLSTGAIGWVGEPGDLGTFGAALLLGHLSVPTITEVDLLGTPTGVSVTPATNLAELALLYQWGFFSVGIGGGMGLMDLGVYDTPDGPNRFAPVINAGTNLSLGRMDTGVGFRMGGTEGGTLTGGLAFRTGGWFKGAIGFSFDWAVNSNNNNGSNNGGGTSGPGSLSFPNPGSSLNRSTVGGGATWEVIPALTVRGGVLGHSGGLYLSTGFSIPWRAWSFDYALQLPMLEGGAGAAHAVGVGWMAGTSRKKVEGPTFFLAAAERTLAVAAFDPQGVSATDAAIISDMVRNRLIKEGAFNIIEKANMDKVLQEQAFQQTGCTSSECAVKLGKVLNVKYLVVGSFGKLLDRFVISMRVVDVETAKGVYSDEASATDVPAVQDAVGRLAANLTEAVKNAK